MGMAYSDGSLPKEKKTNAEVLSVEASGTSTYWRGAQEEEDEEENRKTFGRKVIVRDLNINSGFRPYRAFREVLWQ